MFRIGALLAFCLALFVSSVPTTAQNAGTLFPEPIACAKQPDDASIAEPERTAWTDCEKWAWSCIRDGLEANFFDKSTCRIPRSKESSDLRRKLRLAAFKDPQSYETSNGLGGKFLLTLLSNPHYARQIPPVGIRIFGGYFKDPINLENLTTTLNIVLDGSNMRRGLRLTNFKTEKNLSLDGSNVRGSIYLMRARIDGSLFMEQGIYDFVDLNDSRIGASFEASGSVFNDELRIHRADISGKVILTKARLTTLSGWSARLGSSLEMRLADIRYGVDLTGSLIEGDLRMQDATFGRIANGRCDWIAERDAKDVMTDLKLSSAPDLFENIWHEVVIERPSNADGSQPNVCETAEKNGVFTERNNVLLRDMRIKGALCLVDVTGEIATGDAGRGMQSIGKIAIDGTSANATILSWKASASQTLWYMANYKTSYLQANLENRPPNHFTDNIEVGALTMMKRSAIYPARPPSSQSVSDEYRVREKCDVTPGVGNTDPTGERDVQDRIIAYFREDRSGSSQPFANIVDRIEGTGVNTTHLRIALSEHKYRNTCETSQLMRTWNDLQWRSLPERLSALTLDEARKFTLDGVCAAAVSGYRYSVSYGHEPHNLFVWALLLVAAFYIALLFDRRDSNAAGKRFGIMYAVDNLIPLKTYRFERDKANERPNRLWLRVYLALHRLSGLILAVLAFFFIYRASK